jgi:hypothetical protein
MMLQLPAAGYSSAAMYRIDVQSWHGTYSRFFGPKACSKIQPEFPKAHSARPMPPCFKLSHFPSPVLNGCPHVWKRIRA